MLNAYSLATTLIEPILPIWLWIRKLRGKEDGARLRERYGYASKARPNGPLLWLHAASVGEANSVLLFINKIKECAPHINILMTTGTVTSAQLMAARLPKDAIHQYVPLDTAEYTMRFMRYWKPEIAFFVESELWPNLIIAADTYQCFMGIINGRMSERSFNSWQKRPEMIGNLLRRFNCVFAQSDDDAKRFKTLGAKYSESVGNLKYDATLLPCDESELLALKNSIGTRPLWVAASTHPGEEEIIAQTHELLSVTRPNLLTIIVPRHPSRGEAIANSLSKHGSFSLRSKKEVLTNDTNFYIADTLGELGLFYRLSEIVFMGGSLVAHGGQNPLEAARLSCAIASGPHTHNFADIYAEMKKANACLAASQPRELAAQIDMLLNNSSKRAALGKSAKEFVEARIGAVDKLTLALMPVFNSVKK